MMTVGDRNPDPSTIPGRREHAVAVTQGRHPGVRDALQWLCFSHLPSDLQRYSEPFYLTAVELVRTVLTDSPELTTSLNKLIEAKDSAMRAGIKASTGRAGPVPRPQEVVNPPTFEHETSTGTGGPVLGREGGTLHYGTGQPRPIQDRPQA